MDVTLLERAGRYWWIGFAVVAASFSDPATSEAAENNAAG